MKRVSVNRCVLFPLILCAGVSWDLLTKHVVFTDLGYPRGEPRVRAPYHPGEHAIFDHPENVDGRSVPYLNGWLSFRLYTSFNYGALWGIGQGWTSLFALASFAAIVGILLWLFVFGAAESRWLTVSLAFILSGTLGNLWDRLALHGCTDMHGEPIRAVRDFLLFSFGDWHYPIFNFADVFLVTGAVMLVLQSMFFPPPEAKPSDQRSNEHTAAPQAPSQQTTTGEPPASRTPAENVSASS